jgi:hypothetical protein
MPAVADLFIQSNQNPFMKKLLFGLLALTLLVTACKKEKDQVQPTKENIAGTYKMTAEMYKMPAGQGPDEELFSSYEPCYKDDLYNLILDGTFEAVDAGAACDPSNAFETTWQVEGYQLTVGENTFTITKFDGSVLEVTDFSGTGDDAHGYITTYTKQ